MRCGQVKPERRVRRVFAGAILGLLVLVGCAGTDATSPDPSEGGRDAGTATPVTGVVTLDVVDPSRPTEPVVSSELAALQRVLPTTVYLPAGGEPAPLIVFSHGLGGSPEKFTRLHSAWSDAGFVVAAPRFPLTSDANPRHTDEVGDVANQPGDVSAVLDAVLAATADPASPLFGRVDAQRLGAAGMSLGGATTYGVLFNECCIDDRFTAGMVLAGAVLVYTGANDLGRPLPMLVVHGDNDLALDVQFAQFAFEELGGPAWLVTLLGGDHAGPFEDPETPWDDLVERTTVTYWDAFLRNDPAALATLDALPLDPTLARVDALPAGG